MFEMAKYLKIVIFPTKVSFLICYCLFSPPIPAISHLLTLGQSEKLGKSANETKHNFH